MSKPERRSKPKVTNIDRARTRAARKAARLKAIAAARAEALEAATEKMMNGEMAGGDWIDQYQLLKPREPDDRCERATYITEAAGVTTQPRDFGPPSGILYPNGYKHRDYVPRDKTRTGLLLCILSGVVMGCIIAAVAS